MNRETTLPRGGPGAEEEPGPGTPSQGDLLIENMRGGGELAREILVFPEKPAEYLGRARLTQQERQMIGRLLTKWNLLLDGEMDIFGAMWYFLASTVSLGGKGREEAVAVLTSAVNRSRGLGDRMSGAGDGRR